MCDPRGQQENEAKVEMGEDELIIQLNGLI